MAAKIRLTALVLLVCGLALAWLSSPLGPPLALVAAIGLAAHLGQAIWHAVCPRHSATNPSRARRMKAFFSRVLE